MSEERASYQVTTERNGRTRFQEALTATRESNAALRKLLNDGYTLEHRQTRGGVYLTISRTGLRLSRAAWPLLGDPSPARVFVLRKPGELVILPALSTDQRAYRLIASGTIGGEQLVRRLTVDGWQLGRYRAGAVDGALLIVQGERLP